MKSLLILLVTVLAIAYAEDSDVVVLTDDTFETALSDNENIFVEFYAPWCGHCKRLAPEYEKAATELKGRVPVAKVDCTTEENTCQKAGIQGFPTLKLFRKGQPIDFEGDRSASAIVNFIEKKTGPPATTITTAEDLKAFIASKPTVVVGFFAEKDEKYQFFLEVATFNDDFVFGEVVGNAKDVEPSATTPSVKIYRNWADTVEVAPESVVQITDFVNNNGFQTVLEIDERVFQRYSARGNPIAILFFDTTAAEDATFALYKDVAETLKSTVSFAFADSGKFQSQLTRFGASGNVLPTVIVLNPLTQGKWPWDETKTIEKESLIEWLSGIAAGTVTPFLKSEPIPETNDAPVKVVVGKNFESLVNDAEKDVLLEFYAPWCGHCKTLAPIYEELAQSFANEKSIVIAKIDATNNDTPIQIRGFPTIYLFPANNKETPIEYSGSRSLEDLQEFVRKNAATLASKDAAHDEL